MTTDLQATNFKMFLHTVRTLESSQGFYSRLGQQIDNWTEEERKQAENYWNSIPKKFNSEVDVIMFLEGGSDEYNYKYGKKVLKKLEVNVFNSYYTVMVLDDGDYYNIHVISDSFQDDELNTLRYQEPKECVNIEEFDELRLTKDAIEFAMWNKFYGFKGKSYLFTINEEIDIDEL